MQPRASTLYNGGSASQSRVKLPRPCYTVGYIRTLLAGLVLLSPCDREHDHSCTRRGMDREKDLSA